MGGRREVGSERRDIGRAAHDVPAGFSSRLIRTVAPPMIVAIDLGALYRRTPHFERPGGVRSAVVFDVVVLGYLESWVLASDNGWLGACSYRIRIGDKHFVDQHHFVPQWALKQASKVEANAARQTGQLRW